MAALTSVLAVAVEGAGHAAGATVPGGYGWALLKMLGALVVVCSLAFILLRYGLRRLASPSLGGGMLRVVDRCQLGPGRALWVVEVGHRAFLMGSGERAIELLAELDPEEVKRDRQRSSAGGRRFFELLRGGGRSKPAGPDGPLSVSGARRDAEASDDRGSRRAGGEGRQ